MSTTPADLRPGLMTSTPGRLLMLLVALVASAPARAQTADTTLSFTESMRRLIAASVTKFEAHLGEYRGNYFISTFPIVFQGRPVASTLAGYGAYRNVLPPTSHITVLLETVDRARAEAAHAEALTALRAAIPATWEDRSRPDRHRGVFIECQLTLGQSVMLALVEHTTMPPDSVTVFRLRLSVMSNAEPCPKS